VPSAILFDPGRCAPFDFRPDASYGASACLAATSGPVQMGNVGAGAGARSGGVKGGIGTASALLPNGVVVGAIVAVNSSGRTFDATTGDFFAGRTTVPKENQSSDIWIEVDPGVLPTNVRDSCRTGCSIYLDFLGRRTAVEGHYGHMGMSKHQIVVDRVLYARLLD